MDLTPGQICQPEYINGSIFWQMFCEADGKFSTTRFLLSLVVFYLIINSTYLVGCGATALPDIPAGWLALVGILYGTNKATSIVGAVRGRKDQGEKFK